MLTKTFAILCLLSSISGYSAYGEVPSNNVEAEFYSNIEDVEVDYEIEIMDDAQQLTNWAGELVELDVPDETASDEQLLIYQYLKQQRGARFIPMGVKAQKRTCSALESSRASQGTASWYGGKWHGRKTANGERYNQNDLTAAHTTIPFHSMVRVSYKGRSVIVRINDAGPYYGDRIIDLSKEAASQLGMIDAGLGKVTLEMISCGRK